MNPHAVGLKAPEFDAPAPQAEREQKSEYIVFKYGDPRYATLLRQFFRLRKRVFVDTLDWELDVFDEMEIDQYDQETAEYILQVQDGKCIGGARLLPTTTSFEVDGKPFSYMLRDAHLGRLPGFPQEVTEHIPVDEKVWELTRVISAKDPKSFRDMMEAVRKHLKTYGVENCLFITRTAMYKICKFWGYDIRIIGPELKFGAMKAVTLDCKIDYYKDKVPSNNAV